MQLGHLEYPTLPVGLESFRQQWDAPRVPTRLRRFLSEHVDQSRSEGCPCAVPIVRELHETTFDSLDTAPTLSSHWCRWLPPPTILRQAGTLHGQLHLALDRPF